MSPDDHAVPIDIWSGNEPLDTRPPELWIDLVHDECGGDW